MKAFIYVDLILVRQAFLRGSGTVVLVSLDPKRLFTVS